MQRRVTRKWRPPLSFVLGGTLAAVLGLPLIGIAYFRVAGNILGWAETAWMIAWMAIISTAILTFLLWRLVLRPVWALTDYARAIAQNRGDVAPPEHLGTPELTALGQSVQDMGRVLLSREAVLRGYADHVTHELKSPLTVLRGAAELLDDPELPETERRRLLDRIDQAADRMTALLDAQRALARAQEPAKGGQSRLSDVLDDFGLEFPGVTFDLSRNDPVPLPEDALRLVLEHLFTNAADHGATRITLAAGPETLVVSDNGPGISQGNRNRIFDPFFTTRRESGGTGMGLPIVRRILQAHGADIALGSDGDGASFRITY